MLNQLSHFFSCILFEIQIQHPQFLNDLNNIKTVFNFSMTNFPHLLKPSFSLTLRSQALTESLRNTEEVVIPEIKLDLPVDTKSLLASELLDQRHVHLD